MRRGVCLFVAPGEVGGAIDHTHSTLTLIADRGIRTTAIAWPGLPVERRRALESVGCPVVDMARQPLTEIPQLPGSVAIGICDSNFLKHSGALKEMGCDRVWLNLMTWPFPSVSTSYARASLFEAYVFQSEFQRSRLERALTGHGYRQEQGHLIRGAFDVARWPFDPNRRTAADNFVVGKLARPDYAKWPNNLWELYARIKHASLRVVVMGVDDNIRRWIGHAPPWAKLLPPLAMPPREFYRRIHCLMPVNYGVLENWPRIGLEAMACGVPIVAPREGGWCEMITHGENGFLASSAEEFAEFGTLLAHDEPLRQQIAIQARRKLETELANPDLIWAGWQRLFASLGGL